MSSAEQQGSELRLAPESVEALAQRLAELLTPPEPSSETQLVSAAELARLWGVQRRWIYEHAQELGARRLGGGPRPRLRFDPREAAERLDELPGLGCERRSVAMGADSHRDSLSGRSRAKFGPQVRSRPGSDQRVPRRGAGASRWQR